MSSMFYDLGVLILKGIKKKKNRFLFHYFGIVTQIRGIRNPGGLFGSSFEKGNAIVDSLFPGKLLFWQLRFLAIVWFGVFGHEFPFLETLNHPIYVGSNNNEIGISTKYHSSFYEIRKRV